MYSYKQKKLPHLRLLKHALLGENVLLPCLKRRIAVGIGEKGKCDHVIVGSIRLLGDTL